MAVPQLQAAQFGGVVKIARGQRLRVRGVMHQVRRRVDNTRFVVDAVEDGASTTRDFGWLDQGWLSGEIVVLPTRWDELDAGTQALITSDLDAATDAMRRIAYYREPYAEAFDDFRNGRTPIGRSLDDLFRDVAAGRNSSRAPQDYEAPPKRSQLYEFTAKWVKADRDIRALLPNHPGRGNRTARVCQTLSDILDELIEAVFLTPVARTKVAMYVAAKRHIATLNEEVGQEGAELVARIPLPSRAMVEKRCDKLELYDRLYYRKDPIKAAQELLPVGIGPVATRVNERWELDSSPVDVLVIDKATGALLGRPTITAVIDCATRLIIGWWISFEGESTLQIMQAIRHAIEPKLPIPGVRNPNPGRGKPQGIWVDNGKAHRSNALAEAGRRLGFEPFWLPPRRPRLRGKIERWFRTLGVSLIHNLRGTVKSNPKQREDYDAENDAVFTLEEITWIISYWICDVYNVRVHRGTRRSPIGLWRELANEHAPSLPPSHADLNILLSQIENRTVSRRGIEWNGLLYNSPLLAMMRDRPDFDPSQIQIRCNPGNIEYLYVLGPGVSTYQPVPCTNKSYAKGKTLHQHLCVLKHAKERAKEDEALTEGDFELAWGELILGGQKLLAGNGRRKTLKRLGRLFALGVNPASITPPTGMGARIPGLFDDEDEDCSEDVDGVLTPASEIDEVQALSIPSSSADVDEQTAPPPVQRRPTKAKPRNPAVEPTERSDASLGPDPGAASTSEAPIPPDAMEADYD
ncbi:Mu transposase C-terminal domain-containing protein [Methylobacterium oryzae]